MGKTSIEWTAGDDGTMGSTWNPIRGCSRVSAGCQRCYAERVAARFSGPGQPYEGLTKISKSLPVQRRWNGEVRMVPEHLADPLRWRRPRRVFVNSMSDLFHESLTNEQIAAVFGVMASSPRHTFQVLTKRAARMRAWFEWVSGMIGVNFSTGALSRAACDPLTSCLIQADRHGAKIRPADMQHTPPWPLPHVWLGVSVENQAAADERIPELLRTPAAVRWISAEPLLGEVDLFAFLKSPRRDECLRILEHKTAGADVEPGLDWIVAGCESGPSARPCDASWLRSLRDQCAAAGVPYFLKQAVESLRPNRHGFDNNPDGTIDEPIEFGPGSKVKAGGVIGLPYLDGRQHVDMPEASHG